MICTTRRSRNHAAFRSKSIRHEAVPKCGSYEVRFPDGRPSRYFYFEDMPSRRPRPLEQIKSEEAERRAKAVARAEKRPLLGTSIGRAARPAYAPDSWAHKRCPIFQCLTAVH
jgi:hypothetical protein